jgi:hypothetical protein
MSMAAYADGGRTMVTTSKEMSLYHFTDSAHLPWILQTRELRPGRNKIGHYPDPDFLWATTDAVGDRSVAGMQSYRQGKTQLVRFTLAVDDFEPWPVIVRRHSQWTADQIDRLERAGRRCGSRPESWYCRVEALIADRWLLLETKSYSGPWRPFHSQIPITIPSAAGDSGLAIIIDDKVYLSRQIVSEHMATNYEIFRPMAVEEFMARIGE